jgi:hypothetical protein
MWQIVFFPAFVSLGRQVAPQEKEVPLTHLSGFFCEELCTFPFTDGNLGRDGDRGIATIGISKDYQYHYLTDTLPVLSLKKYPDSN